MYKVNDKEFASFSAAVKEASSLGACVVEIATGLNRWSPAPKVSTKKVRRYNEQKSAYEAQQSIK